MKKLIALLMLLTATFVLNAQVGTPILSENFDNGYLPSGWTLIDADDDGHDWTSSIPELGVGYGHNGSDGCFISMSFDNDAGVLYPDNWLVTPPLNLTSAATLSYWVCAQDAGWPAEHYGVYISTTSATDPAAFTLLFQETIAIDAKEQSPWVEHVIDLAAYTGDTVYIAFRHFNSSDMFYLDLDDVTVTTLPETPTIAAIPDALVFQSVVGSASVKTTSVIAYNLTSNITATAALPFLVSANGTDFGSTASLPQDGGNLYVKFAPTATGMVTGTVILSSTDAENDTIQLTGTGLVAATLPYTQNFENDNENAQWTILGEDVNKWVIGTSANATLGGSHALYVSNDNGVSNAYSHTESTSWAFRDFDFGLHAEYNISFDFRGAGESTSTEYDYLRVFIGDIVELPVWEHNHPTPAGLTLLGTYTQENDWTPVSITLGSEAAGPQRLYFLWWNDNSVGSNPPAAVDNLVIVYDDCGKPTNATVSNITAHTATFSFVPALESDNVWEYALCPDSLMPNDVAALSTHQTSVNLTGLIPSTDYHIYVRTVCTNNQYSDWSDVVDFTTHPTCSSPTNLTVSQIAGASVLLSWNSAPYGATAYNVAYRVFGEESWDTIANVVNTQILLSGLEQLTTYEVAVTSVCDEDSAAAAVQIFTTKCLVGGDLQIGEGTATSSYLPSYCYFKNSYTQQIFLASELNGSCEIHSISFDMATAGASPNSVLRNLKIYLMHTTAASDSAWLDASNAQLVYSNPSTPLAQGWNTFDFSTPFAYNGSDNLAIIVIDSTGNYGSSNYWNCHSTDVGLSRYTHSDIATYSVYSIPTTGSNYQYRNNVIFGIPCDSSGAPCAAPNLTLNMVSSSEITISWVAGYQEAEWVLQYRMDNENEWTSLGTVTTSPYTIGNLASNTLYHIRLGAPCNEGYAWSSITARTECAGFAIPFNENFDSYFGTYSSNSPTSYERPICWYFPITFNSSPYIINTSSSSAPNSLFFRSETTSPTTAVTPAIDANMETLRVKFMLRAENPNNSGTFEVGVMSDPYDMGTFESVTIIQPDNSGWNQYFVDLNNISTTGSGHHIAFRQHSNSSIYFYWLDDLNIIPIPSCQEPTDLASENVTAHSANLTWSSEGNAFNLYYKTSANMEWTVVNNVTLNNNVLTLSGLNPETTYIWRVATICEDGSESISNQSTFTTLVACPAPQDLTVSNITSNSATLTWVSDAESFTIVYGETGFAEGGGITVPVTGNTYNLVNLSTATSYTVFLTASCGVEGSSIATSVQFNTLCDAINTFPYTENFENNGNIPTCWSQEYVNGTVDWQFRNGENSGVNDAHSGNYNAFFFFNSNTEHKETKLVSPVFDLSNVTNPFVSYWHVQAVWGIDQDRLSVYYRTSPSAEWQLLEQHLTSLTTWTLDSLALPNPSATYQIAFEGYSTWGYGIALDDIQVYEVAGSGPIIVTDPTVITDSASVVEQTTATMNATIVNPDNLEITGMGFLWKSIGGSYQSVAGVATDNTFSYELTDLTPNTQYTYRAFITYNGGNIYGDDVSFTTLPEETPDTCDTPENLHIVENGIHNESLEVAWDAQEGVNSWNLRHRPVNGEWDTISTQANSYTITGLTGLTTYEIQVQAVCDEDNVSNWSGSISEQTTNVGIVNHLEGSVVLFPNPARDVVNVQCTMNNVQFEVTNIEVFDVYGKLITNINVIENPTTIRISDLADGMYFVRVTTDNGAVTKTFVKQ